MESWVQSLEVHALAMVVEDLEYIRLDPMLKN